MWWMLACTTGVSGIEFPLTLAGDGVVARVTQERGCQGSSVRVGLWGRGVSTEGEVLASMGEGEEGTIWLNFPVQTGLGTAVAAIRLQGDSAILPLGSRPGEFEVHMSKSDLDGDAVARQARQAAEQLEREVEYWRQGSFLLVSDDGAVGEIRFRGDRAPIVSVHDAMWLTPRPVEATMQSKGAEIMVGFTAEPSLRGEDSLLRINVPERSVVVPLGPVPVAEERTFRLEPGELTDAQRRTAIESAVEKADMLEKRFVEGLAPKLSAASGVEEGACLQLPQLAEEWSMMVEGYDVQLEPTESGCSVGIEPSRPQHGRRFRGVIQP